VFDLSPVYAIVAVAVGTVLAVTDAPAASLSLAVGPQYDTTHVYIAPEEFDSFSDALVATFGGTKSQAAVINITPDPQRDNVAGRVYAGRHLFGVRI
jgi:hypothetical protein